MKFNPEKHHRRSPRLKGYDYSLAGAYYVTICTHERKLFFGDVLNGEMHLNEPGRTAQWIWMALPQYFPTIELDQFVIMPNHVHGIVVNTSDEKGELLNRSSTSALQSQSIPMPMSGERPRLGQIVRKFKALTTYYVHTAGINEFAWQERFHDRVVRNETDLNRIREYIYNNPARWSEDDLYV